MNKSDEILINFLKNNGYTELKKDNPGFLKAVNKFCEKYGTEVLNEIDMDFSGDL